MGELLLVVEVIPQQRVKNEQNIATINDKRVFIPLFI